MKTATRSVLPLTLAMAPLVSLLACAEHTLPTDVAPDLIVAQATPSASLTVSDLTCTTSWIEPAGGDWHEPANWDNGVPDAAADACLSLAAGFVVSIAASAEARTLGLGNPGAGEDVRLQVAATLTLGEGGATILSGGVLDWIDDGLELDGELLNEGVLRIGVDAPLGEARRLVGDGAILNHGVLRRQGTGAVDLRVPVVSGGMIEALSGTLQFRSGGTFTASATFAASDGLIEFQDRGGSFPVTYLFADGLVLGGEGGNYRWGSASTLELEGSLAIGAGVDTRPSTRGLVTGVGPVLVDGTFRAGLTEVDVVVRDGGTLLLSNLNVDAIVFAAGTTVTNEPGGTILWDRASFRTDGEIRNHGIFAIDGEADDFGFAGGEGTIVNDGVLRRQGTGAVDLWVPVVSGGAIEALSGDIRFRLGGTFTASATFAAADGRVEFQDRGGSFPVTYFFADGLVLGGEGGSYRWGSASTLELEGSLTVGAGVAMDPSTRGLVTGVGPMLVDGTFEPGLTEVDVIVRDGGLLLFDNVNTGAMVMGSGTTVTNRAGGSIEWHRGSIQVDGVVENHGTFTIEPRFFHLKWVPEVAHGSGRIDNHGLFRVLLGDADAYTAQIEVAMRNLVDGIVSAEATSVAFGSDVDNHGGAVLQGTGTLDFGASAPDNAGITSPGLSPGILTVASDFAIPAGATLRIELAGSAPSQHDRLDVEGEVRLGGLLEVVLLDGFVPVSGERFEILRGGAVTGTFGEVRVPDGFTGHITDEPTRVLLELREVEAPPGDAYVFTGFTGPVKNPPEWNRANAGRVVPLRFGLGGFHGTDILAAVSPSSRPVTCGAPEEAGSQQPIGVPGNSGLTYDPVTDEYQLNWRTDRRWRGTCRELVLRFDDGSEHTALFQFR